jgi:hypothetical protein
MAIKDGGSVDSTSTLGIKNKLESSRLPNPGPFPIIGPYTEVMAVRSLRTEGFAEVSAFFRPHSNPATVSA